MLIHFTALSQDNKVKLVGGVSKNDYHRRLILLLSVSGFILGHLSVYILVNS
ncbi:hypothetical protein PCC7424_2843 [Gloeothece citriformis PCC 7424]|uniref:Uncharacterized protein n=1 Tax=Gloeothece citriformis (strain PCC 7424) TaxID=65393 RepID=B7K8Q1_GLOC7|nr:hypothetical protein PCC7424_2843 [Gloeothece citriformis PCC 7424]